MFSEKLPTESRETGSEEAELEETKPEEESRETETETPNPEAKLSGINKIVGKLEIAYNQSWLSKHEEKAAKIKDKMDGLDMKTRDLDQAKEEIMSTIGDLKEQKIPGVGSLELKLKDIEEQKVGLLDKKDKLQSKFEFRENKAKLYTNERDIIVDKFIGHYNEKLKPMERELTNLQTNKDEINMLMAVAEVKHKEETARLNDLRKRKTQLEKTLKLAGMSEKKIKKFETVKEIRKLLVQGQERIKLEKKNLALKKAEINRKIVKIEKKANPYRDKREKFTRIKNERPLEMGVKTRERGKEFKREEEVEIHIREKREETAEEERKQIKVSAYVSRWNTYLRKKYGKKEQGKRKLSNIIDKNDFLRQTGLSKNSEISFNDFKNILKPYCKFRKIPVKNFERDINEFFREKIKK